MCLSQKNCFYTIDFYRTIQGKKYSQDIKAQFCDEIEFYIICPFDGFECRLYVRVSLKGFIIHLCIWNIPNILPSLFWKIP